MSVNVEATSGTTYKKVKIKSLLSSHIQTVKLRKCLRCDRGSKFKFIGTTLRALIRVNSSFQHSLTLWGKNVHLNIFRKLKNFSYYTSQFKNILRNLSDFNCELNFILILLGATLNMELVQRPSPPPSKCPFWAAFGT